MDSEHNSAPDTADKKSIRLLRPSIVVLCGPAACGKTTFAERHFRPTQIISSDWARARVSDDERDQRCNPQAFALVHFLIEQRLMVNRLCVVDSTALTTEARKDLLDLARKYQVPAALLLFNVPLQTCLERDEKRERTVGKVIIERQYQAFEQNKTTMKQEGFDQVVEIQEGDLEMVQIEILFRPVARATPRPPRPNQGAPRRFERTGQPSGPRPGPPGGNGHPVPNSAVSPVPRPPAVPRAATTPGFVSTPKEAPHRSGETPPAVAHAEAAAVASPALANKPAAPPATDAPAKPSPAVAPRPAPAGGETPGKT